MLGVQFDIDGEDGGIIRYNTEESVFQVNSKRKNVVQQQVNYRLVNVCDNPHRNGVMISMRKFADNLKGVVRSK